MLEGSTNFVTAIGEGELHGLLNKGLAKVVGQGKGAGPTGVNASPNSC